MQKYVRINLTFGWSLFEKCCKKKSWKISRLFRSHCFLDVLLNVVKKMFAECFKKLLAECSEKIFCWMLPKNVVKKLVKIKLGRFLLSLFLA